MSIKKYVATLHCQPHERGKVITKGTNVGTKLIAPTFIAPTPWTAAQIKTENDKLILLDGAADKGSETNTEKANEQSEKVYNMLHDDLHYVDTIALGVKSVIEESGYDASEEPVNKPIPNKPVIKEVIDGKVPHSGKILMAECESRAMHIVETRVKNDPASVFTFAMQSTNSHALVIENLTRAVEYEVRVKDQNATGTGTPSNPYSFLAR